MIPEPALTALHQLAAWDDGPGPGVVPVDGSFDQPGAAKLARETLASFGIEGPPPVELPPLVYFKVAQQANLAKLMAHFDSKLDGGYQSLDHLLADMLDDVMDIWVGAHLGLFDSGCDVG